MMVSEREVVQRIKGLTETRLRSWIARGWIVPLYDEPDYRFSELDIARCDLIRQFRDELDIDSETVPVVLSLLDQVYGLRRELRCVMRAIEQQPSDVRDQIMRTARERDHEAGVGQ